MSSSRKTLCHFGAFPRGFGINPPLTLIFGHALTILGTLNNHRGMFIVVCDQSKQ